MPVRGYEVAERDDAGVLFIYRNRGAAKVAVRVIRPADGLPIGSPAVASSSTDVQHRWGPAFGSGRIGRTGRSRTAWAPDTAAGRALGPSYWVSPRGPQTLRATSLYIRDPRGLFSDRHAVPYLARAALPADARFRRGRSALWLAADGFAMYVKTGARIERWPKVSSGIGCA